MNTSSLKLYNINRALYYIALFIFLLNISNAQLSKLDTKCIWILRETLTSPEKIDSALTYAYNAGFNKVLIDKPSRTTPAFAKANKGMIPKAT